MRINFRLSLILTGLCLILSALGLPLGSWALALALPLFGVGCLAMIVGAEAVSQRLMAPALALIFFSITLGAVEHMARAALSHQTVQLALGAGLAALVVALGLKLASRGLISKTARREAPRMRVRRRAAVAEPVEETTLDTSAPRKARAPQKRAAASEGGDEIHLFT